MFKNAYNSWLAIWISHFQYVVLLINPFISFSKKTSFSHKNNFYYLLWMTSFMKDWLFSGAMPYPEINYLQNSLSLIAGYLIKMRVRDIEQRMVIILTLSICAALISQTSEPLILIAVIITAFSLTGSSTAITKFVVLLVVIIGFLFLASLTPHRVLPFVLATTVTLISALWAKQTNRMRGGLPIPIIVLGVAALVAYRLYPANSNFSLIGAGLGQGTSSVPGQLLLQELGAICSLATLLMVWIAISLAGFTLMRVSEGPKVMLAASCLGGIVGLFTLNTHQPVFLTMETWSGTLTLALLVSCGILAQIPLYETISPECLQRNKLKIRVCLRTMIVITGCAVLITMWLTITAIQKVRTLKGAAEPAGWKTGWTPISMISTPMLNATVAMEDGSFYRNDGIDWEAVHRALRVDMRAMQIRQGGSTITQQLARNLFLTQRKTFTRKYEEMIIALVMARMLPKQRVLELYLNSNNYHMGNFGITTAARNYYHIVPSKLTLAQSALLVGIVPLPLNLPAPPHRDGIPRYPSVALMQQGKHTALMRIAYFYPAAYSQQQLNRADELPVMTLIYPWKQLKSNLVSIPGQPGA